MLKVPMTKALYLQILQESFGDRLLRDVSLARYTSARAGGPADAFIVANSVEELVATIRQLWEVKAPLFILGGGSNLLVSDAGIRGVVVLNRARKVRFDTFEQPPTVRAESGANFGVIARQCALQGLSGLEWAAGIPGTVGGAVFGNAGAHGGEVADNLILAEILHRNGADGSVIHWPVDKLDYGYRTSALKRKRENAVILAGLFRLERSTSQVVQAKMDEFSAYRRQTQPPGASMGSMFKNPPGDHAGRLIESTGLKGARRGEAEISSLHANFFINHGGATAKDIWWLISTARQKVLDRFGINLELEIELVGEWNDENRFGR